MKTIVSVGQHSACQKLNAPFQLPKGWQFVIVKQGLRNLLKQYNGIFKAAPLLLQLSAEGVNYSVTNSKSI